MSSEPGVSSYDKIFGHLAECPEFKDCRAAWRRRLSEAPVMRYDFLYSRNFSTGEDEVTFSLKAVIDGVDTHVQVSLDKFGVPDVDYHNNTSALLQPEEADKVVRANFGTKRCRTYFCKIEKVIEGDTRRNHSRDGFRDWARKKLRDEDPVAMESFRNRVIAAARATLASPQFAKDKQRFFERKVIDQIRGVVLKFFDKVGPEVVKEALDEVVAHAIMES